MTLKEFDKFIHRLASCPTNKKRKVGFSVKYDDSHYEFYEIEPSDITLGTFEDTDLSFICLGDFKHGD